MHFLQLVPTYNQPLLFAPTKAGTTKEHAHCVDVSTGQYLTRQASTSLVVKLGGTSLENSFLQTQSTILAQPSRLPSYSGFSFPMRYKAQRLPMYGHRLRQALLCQQAPSLPLPRSSSAVLNSLDPLEKTWRVLSKITAIAKNIQHWKEIVWESWYLVRYLWTPGTAFQRVGQRSCSYMYNSSVRGCTKNLVKIRWKIWCTWVNKRKSWNTAWLLQWDTTAYKETSYQSI